MKKVICERLLGSDIEIRKRMETVYGGSGSKELVKIPQNNNKKKYLFVLACTVLVIFALIASMLLSDQGVITEEGSIVVALERPEGEKATRHMLTVREAASGTKLAVANIALQAEGTHTGYEAATDNRRDASVEEAGDKQNYDKKARAAKHVLTDIGVSTQGAVVVLPKMLPDGTAIIFEKEEKKGNIVIIVLAAVVICLFIYFRRYREVDLKVAKARESVLYELPDFINKLVLLLEAGLIVTSAFDRILERPKEDSYFYSQLLVIQNSMKQTNSSFEKEFGGFARRIGVRELMRASNIIGDNIDKGAALSEKLMAEGNLLWHERKKSVEENGRLAETKLTFPLMILLIVLIMITIAPAMMEM